MDVPNKTHHRSKTGSDPLALETNLQLLPLIMDNIPQAVFWKDRDLIYLGCNQAFAEDAGLDSPEQIIGKTDYDMPWTDQAELYRSDDAQVIESGEAKVNFEEPQTNPSGEITWLRTSKIPVRDESGEVVAVLGMYEDITETKLAEQVMKGNENRLRAVYEGTSDAVMLLTPDGFFDCNPRTLELFGFDSVEEFIKVHPADISPPYQPDGQESFPAAQKSIMTAYEKGYNRFEWIHRRTNGEDFPAEVLLSAFEIEGKKVLQATVRDISERKKVENALKQSEHLLNSFINNFPDGVWAKDTEVTSLMKLQVPRLSVKPFTIRCPKKMLTLFGQPKNAC
jgi:PAS domain S-box-containing protein